jgi:hypothetical protein
VSAQLSKRLGEPVCFRTGTIGRYHVNDFGFCDPEVSPLEVEGDIYKADQNWHFDERPDHGGKRSSRVNAEDGDSDGDSQFEVVACRREGKSRRLRVVGPEFAAYPERDEEHHDEIDEQRQRDSQHVERQREDVLALSENITTMVKRSETSVSGLIAGINFFSYHSRPRALISTNRESIPAKNGIPR